MKFKLIWIIAMFLLFLFPLVEALPFNAFNRTGNESCGNVINWTGGVTANSGECQVDGVYGRYINRLPNASANTKNWSLTYYGNFTDAGGNAYIQFMRANTTSGTDNAMFLKDQGVGAIVQLRNSQTGAQSADCGQVRNDGTEHFFHWVFRGTFASPIIALFINGSGNEVCSLTVNSGYQPQFFNFNHFEAPSQSDDISFRDLVAFNGSVYPADPPVVIPDTTPPEITLANLTSEGGLGQIINLSNPFCLNSDSVGCNIPRTNDTTPTFSFNLSENADGAIINNGRNLNYSDITKGSSQCSTTGGDVIVCTLDIANATGRFGLHNFSIGLNDTAGNENLSGALLFTVNITDPIPPFINLDKPNNNDFFRLGINNTNIRFNGTCDDNVDERYNITGYIDSVQEFSNATYKNGTEFNFSKTVTALGAHTWNITCIDSFNNINSSQRTFTVEQAETVTVFLDLVNDTGKYEFRSIVNISANCTERFGLTCQVEIDLDAPGFGFNFSVGNNFTSFLFNITTLRNVNFSTGPSSVVLSSSANVNITSDNKTIMQKVSINVTSSGTTTNLNITYFSRSKRFFGDLKSVYLEQTQFIESNVLKDAVNLTYATAGSNFIFVNLIDIDNPINITFQLSGFNLDEDNIFSYNERFNGTDGTSGFNETLTFQGDAPLGVLDDFEVDNGRWNSSKPTATFSYINGFLEVEVISDDNTIVTNKDNASDLRNSTKFDIQFYKSLECSAGGDSASARLDFDITDGTSIITPKSFTVSCSGGGGANDIGDHNFTLINKKTSNDKTWELFINGTSQGNSDLSSLDFNKRITFQFRLDASHFDRGSSTTTLRLYQVNHGGGWLNRSINNGTYKRDGNITSNVLNRTKSNLIRTLLTAVDYTPPNTSIRYFLGNECTENPTFEEVTSGLLHTFGTTGTCPRWRAKLNSSDNLTSPVIRKVLIEIIIATAENVTVDLGNDGIDEFTFTGILNDSNSPTFVNLTPTANQLNTIKISSITAGQIQVDNFRMNASINPINLTASEFEDCSNCTINFTFSGDSITVDALEFDFLGSWNYTAVGRYLDLRSELLIQVFYSFFNISIPSSYPFYDVFPSSKDSKNVTPFTQTQDRAIWNVSNLAYDENIDIYVKTNETVNACLNSTFSNNTNRIVRIINESFVWVNGTAIQLANSNLVNGTGVVFNQSDPTFATIAASNYTIDYADGTITLNTTAGDIGLDRTLFGINYSIFVHGFNLNTDYTFRLNTSYQQILTNISVDTTNFPAKGIWNWWSFYNCSAGIDISWFYFASICTNCFFEETQLDNFNLIIE